MVKFVLRGQLPKEKPVVLIATEEIIEAVNVKREYLSVFPSIRFSYTFKKIKETEKNIAIANLLASLVLTSSAKLKK